MDNYAAGHPRLRLRVKRSGLLLGPVLCRVLVLVAPLLVYPVCRTRADETTSRPNILIFLTDDHGYADVGVQGCRDIATPHLDALARGGVQCTDGYVSCPVCSPTRAGLLTGRYQQRFGFEFNPSGPGAGLDVQERTIADLLGAKGYATGLIGKWHLGTAPQFHPLERGFAEFYGMIGGAHHYLPASDVPKPKTPAEAFIYRLTGNSPIVHQRTPVADPDYLTDEFARQATAFIDQHRKQPFFLLVAFNAVHVPLQATKKYLDRFPEIEDPNRRTYAGMLSAVDDAVGLIQQKLVDEGLEQRTLIFFLSDNGGHPQANAARNYPLRGAKSTVYEGGIRVPFFVKWRGTLPAGRVYSPPVISLDILPTALAAAGSLPTADLAFDGVNLLPYLRGEEDESPHQTLYWRYGTQRAIRHGDWKLSMPADEARGLFNLATDVSESKDQSQSHPEIVSDLMRRYDTWNLELQPPRWKSQFLKDAAK